MTETTNPTVKYERETCGRCGGSGSYSYNQIDGSRCYGCNGSGQKLSKRGRAARAFADSILEVTVDEFAKMEGRKAKYTDVMTGRRTTISGAKQTGTYRAKSMRDEDWKEYPMFSFLAYRDGVLTEIDEGAGSGIRVRLVPTVEDIERINAYQDSLTKAGKPRKRG